jgi:hypothetical protein
MDSDGQKDRAANFREEKCGTVLALCLRVVRVVAGSYLIADENQTDFLPRKGRKEKERLLLGMCSITTRHYPHYPQDNWGRLRIPGVLGSQ